MSAAYHGRDHRVGGADPIPGMATGGVTSLAATGGTPITGDVLLDGASGVSLAESGQTITVGADALTFATWDAIVVKAADESVSSSTTTQNDDHLFFATVSGAVYELELEIIYASPAGAGAPDIGMDFGEDNTVRGCLQSFGGLAVGDTFGDSHVLCNRLLVQQFGTAATDRLVRYSGWIVGGGGTFRLRWAQATSNANATTVRAGSLLRYRRIV